MRGWRAVSAVAWGEGHGERETEAWASAESSSLGRGRDWLRFSWGAEEKCTRGATEGASRWMRELYGEAWRGMRDMWKEVHQHRRSAREYKEVHRCRGRC